MANFLESPADFGRPCGIGPLALHIQQDVT
jgi:hypothetical protein